jgi:predicted permease
VAFALVLLIGAGLLFRSFMRVLDVELGFRPERLAALQLSVDRQSDLTARNAYFDETLQRAQGIPGIHDLALTEILPFGGDRSWQVRAVGKVYDRGNAPEGFIRVVSEGYFATMGIPLKAGRDFARADSPDGESVVIVNEMLAETLWPGEDPIGKSIDQDGGRRVVGIVGNVIHQALEAGYTGEMYLPLRQTYDYGSLNLVVRTDLPPNALASSVRAALAPIAPNLAANEWQTEQALIDKVVSPRRLLVLLLAAFALFALALASLGIYAVISHSVSQRRQEIGIRMALGASTGELQRSILLQTLKLAAIGAAIGLIGSWALGRAIQKLLFDVAPSDPVTFAAALAVLAAIAAIAGYLPARRASRLNPLEALGAE